MGQKYVDCSLVGPLGSPDLGHAGTEVDPYSADDFFGYTPDGSNWTPGILNSANGSDSYKLKNSGESLSVTDTIGNAFPSLTLKVVLENWLSNEAWRFKFASDMSINNAKIVRGIVSCVGGFVESNLDSFSSIFIANGDVTRENTSNNWSHKGSIFIANRFLGTNNSGTIEFTDCIFDVNDFLGDPSGYIYNNCAFTSSDIGFSSATLCQFSWTAPTWPAWNVAKENWSNSTLSTGITTPPQPGAGSPDYTDYETGPWGNTRTGIGAFYFPPPPRINSFNQASAVKGQSVVSTINQSSLVDSIQNAGTDTYFDSTSEIHSVAVRYTHEDRRQRINILHRGPGLVGTASWPSVARDGTWEKDRVITADAAGASNTLLRSDIGTEEDIVMTDGTMALNT